MTVSQESAVLEEVQPLFVVFRIQNQLLHFSIHWKKHTFGLLGLKVSTDEPSQYTDGYSNGLPY